MCLQVCLVFVFTFDVRFINHLLIIADMARKCICQLFVDGRVFAIGANNHVGLCLGNEV